MTRKKYTREEWEEKKARERSKNIWRWFDYIYISVFLAFSIIIMGLNDIWAKTLGAVLFILMFSLILHYIEKMIEDKVRK